jgi:hypothetical protein
MNTLPKYVVSAMSEGAGWEPTTVLRGEPVEAVGNLKARRLRLVDQRRPPAALVNA